MIYQAQIFIEAPQHYNVAKFYPKGEFKSIRSQDKAYEFKTPQEAFEAIGMSYGVIGWQDNMHDEIEIDHIYEGIDSYGRTIKFKIIEQ